MATEKPTTIRSAMPAERLLSMLLDGADLLDVRGPDGAHYLLVEVPAWLLGELAAHGADAEDAEDGADHEAEEIEPNVAAPTKILPSRTYAGDHAKVLDWRNKSLRLRCA